MDWPIIADMEPIMEQEVMADGHCHGHGRQEQEVMADEGDEAEDADEAVSCDTDCLTIKPPFQNDRLVVLWQ